MNAKREEQSDPAVPSIGLRWFGRFSTWLHLKKLQREVRNSERFQKKCEQLRCFALAELEEEHRMSVVKRLKRMESREI